MSKITPNIVLTENKENKKVAIVYSSWHSDYILQIREKLKEFLNENGIKNIIEREVPGCNEIPFVSTKISETVDGIICVGILIKGDTLHFENISSAVSNGIMLAQIITKIPMMNVILSCYDFQQLEERINGDKSTLEYVVKGLIQNI